MKLGIYVSSFNMQSNGSHVNGLEFSSNDSPQKDISLQFEFFITNTFKEYIKNNKINRILFIASTPNTDFEKGILINRQYVEIPTNLDDTQFISVDFNFSIGTTVYPKKDKRLPISSVAIHLEYINQIPDTWQVFYTKENSIFKTIFPIEVLDNAK